MSAPRVPERICWETGDAQVSTDWTPGDPLLPNHSSSGYGGYTSPIMTAEERAEALAADDGMPPPWWRPEGTLDLAASRRCVPCGVRWRGPEPCWMCGEEAAA